MQRRKRHTRELHHWRRRFVRLLARMHGRADPKTVHDLRVAARRMRAYARMLGNVALDRDLRWLIHSTNDLRDIDVANAKLAGRTRLSAAREQLVSRLHHDLKRRRLRRLVRELDDASSLSRGNAKKWIKRLRRRAARRTRRPRSTENAHALRRTLREIEYCLDWIGEDSSAERAKQKKLSRKVDQAVVRRIVARLG